MEIAKQDQELIAALRAQTGEKGKPFPKIPSIVIDYNQFLDKEEKEINPKFGQFAFEHIEGEGENFKKELVHIGPTLTCVILRNRYMGKHYDSDLKTTTAYTHEFDDFKEEIKVFGKDKEVLNMGIWKQVKEHSTYKLSSRLILYVWYEEKVYRLNVSGGSMGNLWEYQNRLSIANTSMAAMVTDIGTTKEKKGKVTYFNLSFAESGLFDIPTALMLTKDLNDALNIYEMSREVKVDHEPEFTSSNIPKDAQFVQAEERISVEDLPF